MIDLKPCKFCGGEAKTHSAGTNLGERYKAKCTKCGATSDLFEDRISAIEAWNKRYSGVNDKDDMPICEGDRIRIVGDGWHKSIPGVYEVCYSDVSFGWYLRKIVDYDDYMHSQCISFSDLNIIHFTDDLELVEKED